MSFRPKYKYDVEVVKEHGIYIRDMCDGTCMSVTNAAEYVVEDIFQKYGNKRIFYYDTEGILDELVHENGEFRRFAPYRGE